MVSRRSVRFFSKKEVPCEILDQIIQMAEFAPMGIPPWDVGCVVLRDRKQVQDLAGKILHSYAGFLKIFKPWVLTLMRPMLGRARYEQFKTFIRPLAEMLVDNQKRGRDALFYDAPVAMIFHHSAYADVPDAVIPCTYAMLAAESLGLGTTMIGSVAPMLQRDKALSALIGIPPGNKAAIVLILGYPAVTFKRAIRRRFLGAK